MLITKTIMIKWHGNTREYYESKGYIFTKTGEEFEVKPEDLTRGSGVEVEVKCDHCNKTINPKWQDYLKNVKPDGKYYCFECRHMAYSDTFEQWCIKHNRQDVLERWDYELNNCKPSEISYGVINKKYYFKCPQGIHESELKLLNGFTSGQKGSMYCKQCNSFAQYLIDTYGKNAIELYWDYNENTVNPWNIDKCSNKKVFIKCQEKDYHGSYKISCNDFYNNKKCPYCSNHRVHPKDSLGQYIINNYGEEFLNSIWSDKNKKSSFDYSPKSKQPVWWKCSDGKHEDFYRSIQSSNDSDFRCPKCQYSKGEKRIEENLINNNLEYIPQKEFDELIGLGNGNLSYDFYLPKCNLLIEYQGIQHEKPIDFKGEGIKKAKENFKKQQEHDRRKREYAKLHNIKLLEIWYWDFENIKIILERVLSIKQINYNI